MRPLLTIFALLLVAAFLIAGCTPQTEADAGTMDSSKSGQMNKVGQPSMEPAGDTDDDDGAEDDDDDKGEVEGVEDDVDKPGDKEDDDKAEAKTSSIQKPEMKLVAYRNAEGQLACPVMNSPIASEKAAFSYADYNGKRYYFCCDGCPKVFDKNKDTYAK